MGSKNILLIVGATVGAGIFSLPLVYKQTGIIPFFFLLVLLAYVTLKINLYYAEVTHSIKAKHQLAGYVTQILGKNLGRLAMALQVFSAYGALIAFAAIGGRFLNQIIGTRGDIGTMLLYTVGTFLLFFAGKHLEQMDEVFASFKGVFFVVLIACALLFFPNSDSYVQPHLIGVSPYLAYGILLFALTGFSIIPEMHPDKKYRSSLLWAQGVILLLYSVFAVAMSPYVFGDEFRFANDWMHSVVNVTGFISVFTTYLMFSLVTKNIFRRDMHVSERQAQGLTAFIPFLAIFFHWNGFLKILSLTGGVFLGAFGLMICLMYAKLFPKQHRTERLFIQILFGVGIVLELLVTLGILH